MTKNYEPPFTPATKRRSATAEDLAARRTDDYPPASRHRVGHTPGLHGEDAPDESQEIIRPGLRTIRGNGGYSNRYRRRAPYLRLRMRNKTIPNRQGVPKQAVSLEKPHQPDGSSAPAFTGLYLSVLACSL